MRTSQELKAIREAFTKVKEDVRMLRGSVVALYKENKEYKEELTKVKRELNKIKGVEEKTKVVSTGNQKIFAHKNTKKIHYETCPYIQKTKADLLSQVPSISEGIALGNKRCTCTYNS